MTTRPLLLLCSTALSLAPACFSSSSTGSGTDGTAGSTGASTSTTSGSSASSTSTSSGSSGSSSSSGTTAGTSGSTSGGSGSTSGGSSGTGSGSSGSAGSTGAGSTGAGSTGGVMCGGQMEGGTIYVDPTLGTDDAQHGNGPGECAVATLDWALGSTASEIILAEGATFDLDVDPAGPVILGTDRALRCPGANPATLSGQPQFGTWNVAVRMADGATVEGCVIVGAKKNGYCLEMGTDGTLNGTDISNCGGAPIRISALNPTGLSIDSNVIDSPSGAQVFFQSGVGSADISSNTFTGNASQNVACPPNSSGITGSNNTGTACDPDCNCPNGFYN